MTSRRSFFRTTAVAGALGFPFVRRSLAANATPANDVDLAKQRLVLGPWIEIDPATAEIRSVAGGDSTALATARTLARGSDRGPYTFPG